MGLIAVAVFVALAVGAALVLQRYRSDDGPQLSRDGYPVGGAPRRAAENPVDRTPAGRIKRLEQQYLTGVGQLISEAKLKHDNPQVEMMLLHERANCPLLETAMKYYLPLYVTVRNGRFAGDTDGKFYDDRKLCDKCVE